MTEQKNQFEQEGTEFSIEGLMRRYSATQQLFGKDAAIMVYVKGAFSNSNVTIWCLEWQNVLAFKRVGITDRRWGIQLRTYTEGGQEQLLTWIHLKDFEYRIIVP